MDEQPVFTDPWWDLRRGGPTEHQQREALHTELLAEVAAGHPLHNQPVEVIGRSMASDDIVVELASGGWARVHLTWKRAADRPPWPTTTFYGTTKTLEEDIHEPA
ncbi:hypothetical protein [Micromonospora sp. URMC 103]|uniref:hypothetical protein n=1 Tax=Micromonospora sp. URMC 103 TaxID=3423406 RepID=UPI003F1CB87B